MLNAFRSSNQGKITKTAVWAMLGLLVVGLTGFGLGGAVTGLANQNVASVGSEVVSTDEFVRTLDRQRQVFQQRTQQAVSMSQARAIGLDQQVLSHLVTRAALNDLTNTVGVSANDEMVRDQLLELDEFRSLSGSFDETAYEMQLRQNGQTPGEFEEQLRDDVSRLMLELSVAAGNRMPEVVARTLLSHRSEERRFSVITVTEDDLTGAEAAPTQADLQAHYDDNPESYTAPEQRNLVYVALTPDMLAEQIEVSDADVRALFDSQQEIYSRPERRIVDQLAFPTTEDAAAAKAGIDDGSQTFTDLAEARGLTAADLSLGAIEADELDSEARALVFGPTEVGVVGPVNTDLGPSLFRINATIGAETTTFEEVQDDLRQTLAEEAALEEILDLIDPAQDLLAAGATLQEIGNETAMELATAALTDTPGEGLLGDPAFRREGFAADIGEERDLIELNNGGIAILRVESIDPPVLRPFEDVRDQVTEDWQADAQRNALKDLAEGLKARLDEGRVLNAVASDAGLDVVEFGPLRRADNADGAVSSAVVQAVFELENGQSVVVESDGSATLAQLSEVLPFDTSAEESADQLEVLQSQLNSALAQDMFQGFARMVTSAAAPSVNQTLIDNTLSHYP